MITRQPLVHALAMACALSSAFGAAAATPDDRDAVLAEIGRHRDHAQWVDALAAIERLQQRAPHDDFLYRLQTLTLADIGASRRAWQLYRARPELFDADQKARFEGDHLAKLVSWSLAYGEHEDTRLEEAEDALAQMQAYLDREGMAATQAPLRIRYDRLILLNRLARHQQLYDEYHALLAEGRQLPDYTLATVGDSLLALEKPDEAIPLLEAAVKADPGASQAHTGLAYAYLEAERPEDAIARMEQWSASEPAWRIANAARLPYANWPRYEADLTLTMLRAYSGDLPRAQRELEERVALAPGNGGLQDALGNVYSMRGWPRRALERYGMAHTLDGRDVGARIGMFDSHMQLQRDDLARPLHDELLRSYPSQPSVQRMDQRWRAHRGWQGRIYAEAQRSRGGGGNSPFGNDGGRHGVELQSPLINDRWRALVYADRSIIDFQGQRIEPVWYGAGALYRFGQLDARLVAGRVSDGIGGATVTANLGWQFDDRWHAQLNAARNDAEASGQARVAGITADSIGATVDFRRDERTSWSLAASQYRYEDGNRREQLSSNVVQRLATRPTWQLEGLGSVYASRGDDDVDRPYFNPSRDASLELGVRLDQQLWRSYQRHLRHRVTASVGQYWQEGFGDALVPSLEYRHEWQLGQGRVFEYGVNWALPVYDGRRERRIGFDAMLRWGE